MEVIAYFWLKWRNCMGGPISKATTRPPRVASAKLKAVSPETGNMVSVKGVTIIPHSYHRWHQYPLHCTLGVALAFWWSWPTAHCRRGWHWSQQGSDSTFQVWCCHHNSCNPLKAFLCHRNSYSLDSVGLFQHLLLNDCCQLVTAWSQTHYKTKGWKLSTSNKKFCVFSFSTLRHISS